MRARDPSEPHRAATPLELFFDLVFVVAIAQAANGLHHGIADDHALEAILNYSMVFFAVWWAWMAFTWFASAYDNDDVPYRIAVLVQLTGALVLAAGVHKAFAERDYRIVVVGYIIMRLAMIVQRIRAARGDPERASTAHRHIISMLVLQTCWIALAFGPKAWMLPGIAFFGTLEMLSVMWAESSNPTTWHPAHIAERYGLLAIIVMGETVLAAAIALEALFESGELTIALLPTMLGGLLTLFAMWWLYFDRPAHDLLTDFKVAFQWGYGHLFIYAAAAAVGAGVVVVLDDTTGHANIGAVHAGAAVAIPAAIYVFTLWALHQRPRNDGSVWPFMVATLALLATPWLPNPLLGVGLVMTALVVAQVTRHASRTPDHLTTSSN